MGTIYDDFLAVEPPSISLYWCCNCVFILD